MADATWLDAVDRHLEADPDADAYTFLHFDAADRATRWSRAQLRERAARAAAALAAAGARGARVVIALPTGPDYHVAFLACLRAGAVAVPIPGLDPTSAESVARLRGVIADCEARLVIAASRPQGLPAQVPCLAPGELDGEPGRATFMPEPDTLAFLQYTSGSTAAPRGVRITHRELVANCEAITACQAPQASPLALSWLPPYHNTGLVFGLLHPLFSATPTVLFAPESFAANPGRWLEAVWRHRATSSGGPNFAYELVARLFDPARAPQGFDLSAWRYAFSGAEPVRAPTLRRFAAKLAPFGFRTDALSAAYGLSEATLLVAIRTTGLRVASFSAAALQTGRAVPATEADGGAVVELVSQGPAVQGLELAIVDPSRGERLAAGCVGEVWVRGSSVARGYWRADEPSRMPEAHPAAAREVAGAMRTPSAAMPRLSSTTLAAASRSSTALGRASAAIEPTRLSATVGRLSAAVAATGLAGGAVARPSAPAGATPPRAEPRRSAAPAGEPWNRVFEARLFPSGDGPYFQTGDLGFVHEGELYISGRLKEMLIVRGRNLFPADLEALCNAAAANPLVTSGALITVPSAGTEDDLVLLQEVLDPLPDEALAAVAQSIRLGLGARLGLTLRSIVFLRPMTLPMTPSRKLQRGAARSAWLAGAIPAERVRRRFDEAPDAPAPPRTATEAMLVRFCEEIAPGRAVGVDTALFLLGFDSIHFTQLRARIGDAFGQQLELAEVFAHPTLSGIAALLDARRERPTAGAVLPALPPPADDGSPFALSRAQRRLYFVQQLDPSMAAYNLALSLELRGALDVARFADAFDRALCAHPMLRARLLDLDEADGEPRQQILPASQAPRLAVDPATWSPGEVDAAIDVLAGQAFDLAHELPVRARLLRRSDGVAVVVVVLHHLVADGWSLGTFLDTLGRAWAGEALVAAPTDYRAWVEHEAGLDTSAHLAWWRAALADPCVLDLPSDRPRPLKPDFRGHRVPLEVPGELAGAARRFATAQGATLHMVLLAALGVLLGRLARAAHVDLGTPSANRRRPELEGLVGLFVDTLVLRVPLERDARPATFREVLEATRRASLGAHAHQDVGFEALVEALGGARDLATAPLFQVMLTLQNKLERRAGLVAPGLEPVELVVHEHPTGYAKLDLEWVLEPDGERLSGFVEHRTDLFEPATVARWARLFGHVLGQALSHPDLPVDALGLIDGVDLHRVLVAWNDTARPLDPSLRLHHGLEAQAARTPRLPAVRFEDDELSYAELNGLANRLALELEAHGVGRGALVGVVMERSLELVVALHGIVKAGAAYVPLDPRYPEARLRAMLADAACPVLLAQPGLEPLCARLVAGLEAPPAVWCPTVASLRALGLVRRDAERGIAALDPAYMIYTSGTTGEPKGVLVPHCGIVNRLQWMQRAFPLDLDDRVLQKTPYGFDVSVWEFFWPLATGATLVVARPEGHKDTAYLVELMRRERITTVHFVPSMFQLWLEEEGLESLTGLRRVICSGEALTAEHVQRFFRRSLAELHNLYGPTEASVDVSWWTCRRDDPRSVIPIGAPIDNMRLYVLDEQLRPLPVGVPGELYLGGVGLALGYHRKPELTARAFVPDPFAHADDAGARLYKTGDLARWTDEGVVEYLGRRDGQVKVRGVRIELAEIELALSRLVGASVKVGVRETATGQWLEAFVATATPFDETALRTRLREVLPEHMVPHRLVRVAEIPLSPSGKADLQRLLREAPRSASGSVSAVDAAPTAKAAALQRIWEQVLERSPIGLDEHFFAAGGDSLRALRVRMLARRQGLHFTLQDLFTHPTIRALAALESDGADGGADAACEPFAEVPARDAARLRTAGAVNAFPANSMQLGMLYHHERAPGSGLYHDVFTFELELPWDEAAFRRALDGLVADHATLRLHFDLAGFAEPLAVVRAHVPVPLEVGAGAAALEVFRSEVELDPSAPPLWRMGVHVLAQGSPAHVAFTLSFHHAILDGWSVSQLMLELFARMSGEAVAVAAAERDGTTLQRFVVAERAAARDAAALRFWAERVEAPATLLDAWPAGARGGGSISVPVREASLRALTVLARGLDVPLKSVLLAVHAHALAAITGEVEVVTGVVLGGRVDDEGGDVALGLYLNTLPVCLSTGEADRASRARAAFEAERAVLPHRRFPLAALQRLKGAPVFDTAFNFTRFTAYERLAADPRVRVRGVRIFERTELALLVSFRAATDALELVLDYDAERFPAAQAELWLRRYLDAIDAFVGGDLAAAAPAELAALPRRGPAVAAPTRDLAQRFFEVAARCPEAVALRAEGRDLSYAELARRARDVAAALAARGVEPGDRVGVHMGRSPELMATIVGILSAGAAYVPLDPSYPTERLVLMAEAADLAGILVDPAHRSTFGELGVELDALTSDGAALLDGAYLPAIAERPAYVLFTSGSTGVPKAVDMRQGPLLALLDWQLGRSRCARTLQFSPMSFDVSFQETWATWLAGGTLVLIDEATRRDPHALLDLLEAERVERLFLPFVALQQLAVADEARAAVSGTALREVVTAGEALEVTPALRRFFARRRGASLCNQYGPTETHVVTEFALGGDPATWPVRPPIGRPLPGVEVFVLDAVGRPVAPGAAGELVVAGGCLAEGYLGRPDLTQERFVSVHDGQTAVRAYRTGDLVRWREGELEFLGRRDAQVKIRGFRVETAEVEAALSALEGGAYFAAAVVMAHTFAPGNTQLVAYVVPRPAAPRDADVRAALAARLPEHMVPGVIVRLETFPLTPSGKVDRRRLPAPGLAQVAHTAARDALELRLLRIWEEGFGRAPIGIDDDFASLGGHSLLAVRLAARIERELGHRVRLVAFAASPSVRSLAASLRGQAQPGALVALREAGTGPCLVLVHPIGGSVMCYAPFVPLLPDLRLFALDATSIERDHDAPRSVEAIAAEYLAALEARGLLSEPLVLGGWSFGGVVAWEMARQLAARGCAVPLVLIDATLPGAPDAGLSVPEPQRLRWFAWELLGGERGEDPKRLRVGICLDDDARLDEAMCDGAREVVLGRVRDEAVARGALPEALGVAQVAALFEVFDRHFDALLSYRPGRLSSAVALLRSTEPLPESLREVHALVGSLIADATNGWAPHSERPIEVRLVGGDHLSLMRPPQLEVLCGHLREVVDALAPEGARPDGVS